jgi:hypothetical protein
MMHYCFDYKRIAVKRRNTQLVVSSFWISFIRPEMRLIFQLEASIVHYVQKQIGIYISFGHAFQGMGSESHRFLEADAPHAFSLNRKFFKIA